MVARSDADLGPDGVPDQPQAQVALGIAAVVAQERGGLVVVGDDNVEVAVVVVIAHGRAAADLLQPQARPHLIAHVGEAPLPLIAEELVLLRVCHRVEQVDVVVEVAVGYKQVAVAIVVVVDEEGTPREELQAGNPQPSLKGHVGEKPIAEVAVEAVGFPLVVGDKKVKSAVAVVVSHVNPHARQRLARVVIGDPGQRADLGKSAPVVAVKQVGGAVAGRVQVEIAVGVVVNKKGP